MLTLTFTNISETASSLYNDCWRADDEDDIRNILECVLDGVEEWDEEKFRQILKAMEQIDTNMGNQHLAFDSFEYS
jgi:uncharacterized protein YecT (DUF1311 family)